MEGRKEKRIALDLLFCCTSSIAREKTCRTQPQLLLPFVGPGQYPRVPLWPSSFEDRGREYQSRVEKGMLHTLGPDSGKWRFSRQSGRSRRAIAR